MDEGISTPKTRSAKLYVHFSFTETGPAFRMPPPCSVVIKDNESAQGHWHIPIISESENEDERVWLCCRRANSSLAKQDSSGVQNESQLPSKKKKQTRISVEDLVASHNLRLRRNLGIVLLIPNLRKVDKRSVQVSPEVVALPIGTIGLFVGLLEY
ncbi:proteinaceous RNase P 1 [Striga asiatica]|uniref:Proteinaceous RNase P 1 n=1 Tax=Striga asiatica TaxID=4170 RepID=A0A5A7Q8C8_STRAF|nr:proteinaceous RNase P 1 [Striga asiatica]